MWLRTMLLSMLLACLSCQTAYTTPQSDTGTVTLSEQDSRDILKCCEAYFLAAAELEAFDAELAAVQDALVAAQAATRAAQEELGGVRDDNAALRADLEKIRGIVQEKDENWKAQLAVEKKKRLRWTLYGFLAGALAGAVTVALVQ